MQPPESGVNIMKRWIQQIVARCQKLRVQLFLIYLLVFTLFFSAVVILVSSSIRVLLIEQIGANRIAVLRQIAERAEVIKASSITLLNLYQHEMESRDLLNGGLSLHHQQQANAYLDNQKKIYDKVFSHIGLAYEAVLVAENGFSYSSNAALQEMKQWQYQPWYISLMEDLNSSKAGTVQFSRSFWAKQPQAAVSYFAAAMMMDSQAGKAILFILVDEQQLQQLYASVQGALGQIYIYDADGFIVSHSNKKMLGKQFIDVAYMQQAYGVNGAHLIEKLGESVMLSTYLDEKTGWTIVEESPAKVIFGALYQTYWILGLFLAVGLGLAVAVSGYISRRISRPLTELSQAMTRLREKTTFVASKATGTQEIDHLQRSFQHMAQEIECLMRSIQEREQQKRVLEVNFLRAQMNPHFLYNMLFSIRCAVEVRKNEQASKMLSAFIDLLRSTLSVKDTMVSLYDELETTRKYLVAQKLRYGTKIHYEIEMQEHTAGCMVPPFILQPLAENAIFHGIEAKNEPGTIIIESSLHDGNLLLTITDDGAGMNQQALERIQARCKQKIIKDASLIGMSNVHNRIRLNYGEEYGMSVESAQGIGTTVTLLMPAVFQEETCDEGSGCR